MGSTRISTCVIFFLAIILFFPSGWAFAQLSVQLTTQEALPPFVSGISRINEPVTVGVPLADVQRISNIRQLGLSGASAGQFRCLAFWPSGNCKWVEVDFQLPALAAGEQSNSVRLTSGSGNFANGAANLATDDGPTITINTGTEGCTFTILKAKFDGLHSVVCNGKSIIASGSTGLMLMAPAYNASASPPVTTCTFTVDCTTEYKSSNDTGSACSVEEPGPVRTAIKCTGGLKDASGNKYMGFLVRMHFYLGKKTVKMVVTLKNADDGLQGSFPISYKGYQSLELRLATNLTRSNKWIIGNDTTTPTSDTFSGARQSVYIYQGYSQSFYDKNYSQNSAIGIRDAVSDIPRSTLRSVSTYAQDGYIIVDEMGKIRKFAGARATPAGWADVKDATDGQGVEIGTSYMAANFPKSLQIMSSGQEVRIGISPDQSFWTGACDGGISPCNKVYYQPWPAYKLTDVYLIFHDSDLGPKGESTEFLKMQYPLIARAPISAYNDAGVFTYPIVSASEEDRYFDKLAARYQHQKWIALTDKVPAMTRFYAWRAGGSGNQVDYRYSDLVHRWLARGMTGRYLNTVWFERYQEQFGWPRADGFRWASHIPTEDLTVYDGYPSKCTQTNQCSDNSGMLPSNYALGYQNLAGASDNASWRHGHWWSLISYYYMTGDEDANDLLKDGVITEFTAVAGNGKRITDSRFNLAWQSRGVNSQLGTSGSIGSRAGNAARYWQYLNDTRASSADIANANTVIKNVLTVIYHDPCATTETGSSGPSAGPTYPAGCIPVFDGYPSGQESRGTSAYRGIALGPNEGQNGGRCRPATGQNLVALTNYVRCVVPFVQALYIDGLWTLAQIEGPTWSEYSRVMDLAYGVGLNTDLSNYVSNLTAGGLPSNGQLVYTMAFDQPNSLTYIPGNTADPDTNGPGPPIENIYMILGQYTGDLSPWRSHWENTFATRSAGQSYNANNIEEYGSQLTAEVINLILHPPRLKLQTVNLGTSYNSRTGQWTISWTPPVGVTTYFLKQHDTKTIVDNIGWNVTTNTPVGEAANSYNWFAAKYTANQPAANASSIAVTAPSTANFMLKALAGER